MRGGGNGEGRAARKRVARFFVLCDLVLAWVGLGLQPTSGPAFSSRLTRLRPKRMICRVESPLPGNNWRPEPETRSRGDSSSRLVRFFVLCEIGSGSLRRGDGWGGKVAWPRPLEACCAERTMRPQGRGAATAAAIHPRLFVSSFRIILSRHVRRRSAPTFPMRSNPTLPDDTTRDLYSQWRDGTPLIMVAWKNGVGEETLKWNFDRLGLVRPRATTNLYLNSLKDDGGPELEPAEHEHVWSGGNCVVCDSPRA